jgi:hypothetical protein
MHEGIQRGGSSQPSAGAMGGPGRRTGVLDGDIAPPRAAGRGRSWARWGIGAGGSLGGADCRGGLGQGKRKKKSRR